MYGELPFLKRSHRVWNPWKFQCVGRLIFRGLLLVSGSLPSYIRMIRVTRREKTDPYKLTSQCRDCVYHWILFKILGGIACNISNRDPSLIMQASPWGVVVTFPSSAQEILRVWNRAWRCHQCRRGEDDLVVELWMTPGCVFQRLEAPKSVGFPTLHDKFQEVFCGVRIFSDTPWPYCVKNVLRQLTVTFYRVGEIGSTSSTLSYANHGKLCVLCFCIQMSSQKVVTACYAKKIYAPQE